jgi:hypothetical protein
MLRVEKVVTGASSRTDVLKHVCAEYDISLLIGRQRPPQQRVGLNMSKYWTFRFAVILGEFASGLRSKLP